VNVQFYFLNRLYRRWFEALYRCCYNVVYFWPSRTFPIECVMAGAMPLQFLNCVSTCVWRSCMTLQMLHCICFFVFYLNVHNIHLIFFRAPQFVLGWWSDLSSVASSGWLWAGWPVFDSRQGQWIFSFPLKLHWRWVPLSFLSGGDRWLFTGG
jgi:hypothetical protein